MKYVHGYTRGASLLEALLASAILALVIVGFMGVLQLGTRLSTDTKAYLGATALAQERMEFLRSLPYDDVGTLDGGDQNNGHGNDPDGDDEGNPGHGGGLNDGYELFSTYVEYITLNAVEYQRRTLIAYIDDEADGTGGHDDNHIKDDYKVVKVRVRWDGVHGTREVSLVSNIVPPQIEQ